MAKLTYIEGLRGVAAFIVVLHHFSVAFYPATYNGNYSQIHTQNAIELFIATNPLNLFINGNFPVCIFFILSAYVLSYKFFKFPNYELIKSAAIRRYFRLAIPVLFSVFVAYTFMQFSLFYNKQAGDITLSTWWLSAFWNFKPDLLRAFLGSLLLSSNYNSLVLWMMPIELFGSYWIFGALFIYNMHLNRTLKSTIYILSIFLLLIVAGGYFLAFMIGLVFGYLSINKLQDLRNLDNYIITYILLLTGLFLGSYPTNADTTNTIYNWLNLTCVLIHIPKTSIFIFYHILGGSLIILALITSKTLKRILSNKLLIFLGKISFSMYLIHGIIIGSLSSYLFIRLFNHLSYNVAALSTILISIPLIIIFSFYTQKYIDNTGIRISWQLYNISKHAYGALRLIYTKHY